MTPLITLEHLDSMTPVQLENFKQHFPEDYVALQNSRPINENLNRFITTYDKLNKVKDDVRKLAPCSDPVLIIGPTGTGKELLAKALHGDRKGEFVDINCAGLPEHLIESELFGHVRGAFTGSVCDKTGLLQSAANGTFFFDEIGELPLMVQAKLLRAIQEKRIRKVGTDLEKDKSIPLSCRFVAATHRDLKEMIKEGKFREDLYHRISTFTLELESLSNRTLDIPLLIRHIITYDRGEINYDVEDIDEFAAEIVEQYRDKLTGNVRQLQNIVRHWHVLGRLPKI